MNQRNFEKTSKNKLSLTNTLWIFILNLQLQLIGWLTRYAYCFSLTLSAFEPIFGLFAGTIWHVSSTVQSFRSETERQYKTQLMAYSCACVWGFKRRKRKRSAPPKAEWCLWVEDKVTFVIGCCLKTGECDLKRPVSSIPPRRDSRAGACHTHKVTQSTNQDEWGLLCDEATSLYYETTTLLLWSHCFNSTKCSVSVCMKGRTSMIKGDRWA